MVFIPFYIPFLSCSFAIHFLIFYVLFMLSVHSQVKLYQNYDPSAGFWSNIDTHPQVFGLENLPILAAHP